MNLAAPLIRAATIKAARSNGDACRPSACEATEAFRRGLEARFVTGTLTERAPAGPGELASILRMRAVLDEPPDAGTRSAARSTIGGGGCVWRRWPSLRAPMT